MADLSERVFCFCFCQCQPHAQNSQLTELFSGLAQFVRAQARIQPALSTQSQPVPLLLADKMQITGLLL